MKLFSLLAVSEDATEIVKYVSILAVGLLLVVVAILGKKGNESMPTKKLAFAGICVSLSFTLAVLTFKLFAVGGSVTLASFVPILIYAYVYGFTDGLIVGLIHGLLNFIESPYILTPATFLLDYPLAFSSVAVMGLFGKKSKFEPSTKSILLGCVCVFALRFLFHFLSGAIFFLQDAVWGDWPAWATQNAFTYSFAYQCAYIPLDALIATFVFLVLHKKGVLNTVSKQMLGK